MQAEKIPQKQNPKRYEIKKCNDHSASSPEFSSVLHFLSSCPSRFLCLVEKKPSKTKKKQPNQSTLNYR